MNSPEQGRSHAPDHAAAYVHDAIHILAMVMQKVGTSPRVVRAGIPAVQGYHGVEGTYTFDANGDGLHQQNIVQNVQCPVRDGLVSHGPRGHDATDGAVYPTCAARDRHPHDYPGRRGGG